MKTLSSTSHFAIIFTRAGSLILDQPHIFYAILQQDHFRPFHEIAFWMNSPLRKKIFIKTSRKLESYFKVISLKSFLRDIFCNVPCGRMQAPYIPVFRHLPKALKVLKLNHFVGKRTLFKAYLIFVFFRAPPKYLGLSKGHQKVRKFETKLAKSSSSLCKKDTGLKTLHHCQWWRW